jgi:hypothetical protein
MFGKWGRAVILALVILGAAAGYELNQRVIAPFLQQELPGSEVLK